jgi:LysR family hydrogen peroxide-inducible transcriptional activator
MIDRYQLRYFLAVVDAGNFSRASAQVNVAQPTLSVGIAKLEQTLGAKLFLRNSKRVHLTEAGARFLARARIIEGEFQSLETRTADPSQSSLIRLGVLTTIPTRLIAQVIASVSQRPDAEALEIVEGNERDLVSRLQRRRIDLALTIVRPGESRFPHEVLYSEGYSVISSATHRFPGGGRVAGEALAGETMIVRRGCEVLSETSRYFTERGVRPRFSFRSANDDRVLAMVKAGLGVALAPDSYLDTELSSAKLLGFDYERQVALLFGTTDIVERRGSAVLEALRALASNSRAANETELGRDVRERHVASHDLKQAAPRLSGLPPYRPEDRK